MKDRPNILVISLLAFTLSRYRADYHLDFLWLLQRVCDGLVTIKLCMRACVRAFVHA